MNHLTILTYEQLTAHMYLLTEGFAGKRVSMGLAVGSRAALLIDAGLGATNELRSYVESIVGAGKPVYCACTHGHTCHLGSAKLFDKAYLNHRDLELARAVGLNRERRLSNLLDMCGGIPQLEEFCKANLLDNTDTAFEDYDDGFAFDLGDITVRALSLPGHTAGSMLLWCPEENWMFTGDAIAQNTSLKNLDRAGLMAYKTALEQLIGKVPGDIRLYCTDYIEPLRIRDVKALAAACNDVLAGRTLNDIPGESNFSDNHNRSEMRAHFVENCSIAYDTEKVGAPRSDVEGFCFFSAEQVSEHVYVLAENNARDDELTLGLVVGDDKALLIDTGMGMNGQLRAFAESIAGSRHIIAASTHGNIDHIGGSIQFEDRRLNERDWPEVGRATGTERRFGDIGNFCKNNAEVLEHSKLHWVDNSNSTFSNIEAGERLDLGGVTVEVLYSGGHTPGHLSYYIPAERICFGGDSVTRNVLLRRLTRPELLHYADNMERLLEYIGCDTKLYSGHCNRAQDAAVIRRIVQACREVVEGKIENDPPCNVLRPDKPGGLRHMHFCGNHSVIYEKGNFEKEGGTITRDF